MNSRKVFEKTQSASSNRSDLPATHSQVRLSRSSQSSSRLGPFEKLSSNRVFEKTRSASSNRSADRIVQWVVVVGLCLVITFLFQGCGMFGSSDPVDRNLKAGLTGCLNDAGERFIDYIQGTAEESDVSKNINCIVDSLALFERFGVGNDAQGMSTQDLHDFVDNVLVTNEKVPLVMIEGIMSLKASWFGGDTQSLKKNDLKRAKEFFQFWRDLSVEYIHTFRDLGQHQRGEKGLDSKGLLKIAGEFGDMFEKFGNRLEIHGNHSFDESSLNNMIQGWRDLHGWDLDPAWAQTFFLIKKMLVSGGDGVAPGEWKRLLRATGVLTGVVVAMGHYDKQFHSGPNKVMNHFRNVIFKFRDILREVFQWNGGSIDWTQIDAVIDSIPDKRWQQWCSLRKQSLKDIIRPLSGRVFASSKPGTVDQSFVEKLSGFFDEWVTGMNLLEELFSGTLPFDEASYSKEEFRGYVETLISKEDSESKKNYLKDFIGLIETYRPMFPNDENQIRFVRDLQYSKKHLINVYWMNLIAKLFLDHYGEGYIAYGRPTASKENFYQVFEDIYDVLIDVKWFDEEERPTQYSRRFLDATVFTFQSDGDYFVNEREMTSFLAFMFSISMQSDKVRKELEPICNAGIGADAVDWVWQDAECFRREFKARRAKYWKHLPALKNYWDGAGDGVRENLWKNWELGARKHGNTEDPMASYDILNLMGMSHFIEGLFISYDSNGDETFQTKEVLDVYKYRLKTTLRDIEELKGRSDRTIEAAFTWTVDEGAKPDLSNLLGLARFGAWVATKPFWNLQSQRDKAYGSISIIK